MFAIFISSQIDQFGKIITANIGSTKVASQKKIWSVNITLMLIFKK